ncbi:DJ-1/PfpI family protein [Dyella solisilvae]|uniref:DJ-1/PfpI family protein n=1 Tax=Dyella solisilvae TaxID=1920168 RepID=A0A370K9Q4_9GAMM|nr:DJ-1/PfpI family protein [Dyella solisilvae]RDI99355.1 DJ-1/PfpI family protein [Dyella solisilvae]
MHNIDPETHLTIGAFIYDDMDQCDFTGPFEALSRVPNSTFKSFAKDTGPVRDLYGLRFLPDLSLSQAPQLDVLLVPGGHGQEALMDDEEVIGFIRSQARHARYIFSVCTGALLCGAAGLLEGKRATTHWTAMGVLPLYGAIPVNDRVVVDGDLISTGGVTAGIDGSLVVVSMLRGVQSAQEIQLYMAYDPQTSFTAGSPGTAPPDVLHTVTEHAKAITARRMDAGRRYQASSMHVVRTAH